jgi:hypothetical protein
MQPYNHRCARGETGSSRNSLAALARVRQRRDGVAGGRELVHEGALATGWRDGAFFVRVKRSSPARDAHVVGRQIRNGGWSLSWQIFNLYTFENVGRS